MSQGIDEDSLYVNCSIYSSRRSTADAIRHATQTYSSIELNESEQNIQHQPIDVSNNNDDYP